MDYSTDLLSEIEAHAKEMMTPPEISALLGIDERQLSDDINTVGHPARTAYLKGVSATALELRRTLHDTALAGSPYAVQECQRLLSIAQSAVS
jgi:hypothetical protein